MMFSLLFNDSLNVIDPPMAILVLKARLQRGHNVVAWDDMMVSSQFRHFFVGATQLGQVVNTLDADQSAVHIEAHSIGTPPDFARCHTTQAQHSTGQMMTKWRANT